MPKYVIGMDFGTLSSRFLLVDAKSGEEITNEIVSYASGVMEEDLKGVKLPINYALQDAKDYLDSLRTGVKQLLKQAKVNPEDIIGLGVDFTASTIVPVDDKYLPLSLHNRYQHNPHAYVKLWKHHAAQPYATIATNLAINRNEPFISRYGHQISSEWLLPKVMEILYEDPLIYENTYRYMEGGDFIVTQLIGKESRSSCQAGYKALWHKKEGYPSKEYLKSLHPKLEHLYEEKITGEVKSIGEKAGVLSKTYANLLGLKEGIPVAVSYIDAHSAVPALGITEANKLLMIIGTSTCHMVLSQKEINIKGISGVVEDGIIPGFFGYEAGQSCVGNGLEWWVEHFIPQSYMQEAKRNHQSIYDLLNEKASQLKPGESGLIALDWLNGNRSILSNSDLTSVIVGLNLLTKPEDIYRALIESTAFGARVIIEQFEANGIQIDELYATGGISKKSPLFMQIYADVTGRKIYIGHSDQAVALGSAILASVAAGSDEGGYDSLTEAAHIMGKIEDKVYIPNPQHHQIYQELFMLYKKLHDDFGIHHKEFMEKLMTLRKVK